MNREPSHPDSVNYGKHWTAQQVTDTFAPSDATVSQVLNWLRGNGINETRVIQTENVGWLAFVASVSELESLVHTEYLYYSHNQNSKIVIATDKYHIPEAIQQHIDYIHPGIRVATGRGKIQRFGNPGQTAQWHPNGDLAHCDQVITPDCIKALYQIPAAPSVFNAKNALGIFEEGYCDVKEDLNLFYQSFSLSIPQNTQPNVSFVDQALPAVSNPYAAGEFSLDVELAYPINSSYDSGVFNTFLDALDGSYCTYCAYGECGDDPDLDPIYPDSKSGGYNGTLMCGVYEPTNVISISYGLQEDDLPVAYQKRQCNEWLKLGLQGIAVLVASGDAGVGGLAGDDSTKGCLGSQGKIFSFAFPNTVGATKVYPGHTAFETESAANDPSTVSSGSRCEIFRNHQPAHASYSGEANLNTTSGAYNSSGRGYPDVAANGDNIAVWANGKFALEGGTSGSTPIFASIVNRLVEARMAIGKGRLGFIAPALYANPGVLNDVTNGTNPGCGTEGFYTARGWDPVSGLGTPNFPEILAYFLALD
ncbi:hypothetical protein BGAL_0385g00070 [Botrytis galanthina]|uniref:Peptidase S53 domain-containing protein n=1 Tax=Botrytis galanthina TaxID=278940 RepID=A0A4S8QP45_9HELO|nr:hypothetical protein BGAL_0385g00070 [Botrytis galanthina]